MNILHCLLLLVCVGIAPDVSTGDMEKLQGSWITVSLINEGKTLVDEHAAPSTQPTAKVRYEGNQWRVVVGELVVASGVFRVDEAKSPRELDVLDESGQL